MPSALAARYARALVDVVTKPGSGLSGEQTTAELRGFVAALGSSAELRHVLASPAVSPAKKKLLIDGLGARLGVSRTTRNFLYVVSDNRRMPALADMAAAFESLLDERMGIVKAEVASAQPLDAERQANLAAGLGRLTGRQVRLVTTVDPALLGGAVARIGSTVYDGSVRGRLRSIERRLAG